MACVRKRRSKWVIDFYDQFGKRHWETVGNNKKEAEERLALRLLEVGKETFRPENRAKVFNEVAAVWYQTQILPSKRPKTAKYYRNMLDSHLLPYFANVRVTKMDFDLIERYMAKKLTEGSISKSSINKTVTALGTILKYAVRHRFIDSNPVSNVQKFRYGPDEMKEEKRFLTPKEIQLLFNHADPKDGPLLQLAVFTGLRQGELLGLQWADIDWNKGQICVRRSLQDGRFYEPKTNASRRKVDIDPELLTELKKWRLRCPRGEDDLDLVFPNSIGKPMNPANMLKRVFFPALRRAGLPRIRFHDLRHTNASLRIEAGQNLKYLQGQLGHSSTQVTLDVYGHLLRDTDQQAAIKLRGIALGGKW